jgi:transaldolase / glucose-6-phosphate isomerase
MSNPLQQLGEAGQAVWLDFIDRRFLETGGLKTLIAEDGLKGVTSNPSIFEKAIGEGADYDDRIRDLLAQGMTEAAEVYERLAIGDIRDAADQLRPVHDATGGADGFVSLEVSPYLAMDAEGTVTEARRLWRAVGRPNLMVKVPGTEPGFQAIRTLVGEGINVNVTLLFALKAYLAVADAHLAGLEAFKAGGGDVGKVAGVASFFVSRIDTQIDRKIDQRVAAGDKDAEGLKALRGKVAIANAKVAYQEYLKLIETPRWKALAAAGARPQRLLWASTGTKDAAYSDVLYVETLIGPDTVNTVPPKTLDAFRDHGRVAGTLTQDVPEAGRLLAEAERLGLDLDGVTRDLVTDGVKLFSDAADKLLAAVRGKLARRRAG